MKTFNIYKNSFGGAEIIKEGWSWPAFLTQAFCLGWIWAFAKGLPGTAIALLVLWMMTLGSLADPAAFSGMSLFNLIVWFGIGFLGNSTRKKKAEKKGYKLIRQVQAPSAEAALAYNHEEEKSS